MTHQQNKTQYAVATILVLFAVLTRVLSAEFSFWNFAGLGAISLFSGAIFKNKPFAFLLPLVAFLLSDLYLEFKNGTGFYDASQFFVYGAMLLIVWLGAKMKQRKPLTILGFSVAASLVFFVVSNFGVWVAGFFPSNFSMYPTTIEGLVQCFTMALPFYKNTFASDVLFSGVLFGAYALLAQMRSIRSVA